MSQADKGKAQAYVRQAVCLGEAPLADLEFDLKFEISDGKNLVKFWGRTFLPARKARKISGRISGRVSDQISEKFSETSFSNFATFFGNFVQQKGGANIWGRFPLLPSPTQQFSCKYAACYKVLPCSSSKRSTFQHKLETPPPESTWTSPPKPPQTTRVHLEERAKVHHERWKSLRLREPRGGNLPLRGSLGFFLL